MVYSTSGGDMKRSFREEECRRGVFLCCRMLSYVEPSHFLGALVRPGCCLVVCRYIVVTCKILVIILTLGRSQGKYITAHAISHCGREARIIHKTKLINSSFTPYLISYNLCSRGLEGREMWHGGSVLSSGSESGVDHVSTFVCTRPRRP